MAKKILISVILIVVVGLGVAYFARNTIVEKAIESSSSTALGTETDLGSASLSLSAASLDLNDFMVRDPEDFGDEDFVTLGHTAIAVETGSILDDEVVVNSFEIDGVRIHLRQINEKGNFAAVMKNIKSAESESSEQRFHIKRISIKDIEVSAKLILMDETRYDKTFTIEDFVIENVGGERGASIGEIAVQVLRPIITKAVARGKTVLPGDFNLSLDQAKQEIIERVGSEVTDRIKKLGGQSDDD